MAYLNVVTIEVALKQMTERFNQWQPTEMIELNQSIGRVLAVDLYAKENLPSFRRSMVDGYAVKSRDTLGASEQSPILLACTGQVEMGKNAEIELLEGHAIYVPTGGEIPMGADAMVMIEHTESIGSDVAILTTPRHGDHIVAVGEDVKSETMICSKGTTVSAQHMGILASLGHHTLLVYQKPKVAILSTGDEIVSIEEVPEDGKVRDCNQMLIRTVLEGCGCKVVMVSLIGDDETLLNSELNRAYQLADVILLSGGSSAGKKDFTQMAVDAYSEHSEVFIHGLAIKPGKPTIVGKINHKPVIGLPGHPAACFITTKAFVEPFINQWMGKRETSIRQVTCIANFQLYAASGRDVYQLVRLTEQNESGEYIAEILYGKSGMVSALAQANAYVVVSMQHEGVLKGDRLTAYLL